MAARSRGRSARNAAVLLLDPSGPPAEGEERRGAPSHDTNQKLRDGWLSED
jgi:hypothetical protein